MDFFNSELWREYLFPLVIGFIPMLVLVLMNGWSWELVVFLAVFWLTWQATTRVMKRRK